jgi:hypothetical protein
MGLRLVAKGVVSRSAGRSGPAALARQDHRGELVSLNSTQGRRILFDLLPLAGLGLSGWELKVAAARGAGQLTYAAARRLTIRGADAIVFVANSGNDRRYENPASLKELADNLNLHEIDPRVLATVLQYNVPDFLAKCRRRRLKLLRASPK